MSNATVMPVQAGTDGPRETGLRPLAAYFLRLGALGFGGPAALVGAMHRDLVRGRRWLSEEDYSLALALAQLMPGPLAAQCAIAIGFLLRGVAGATVVGLAFILPSFVMVLGLAALYVAYGGLWWMQALFYGIGAAVIDIIALAAYKLARNTNKRDPLLWGIFAVLLVLTVVTQTELALAFILAGLAVLLAKAPPRWRKARVSALALAPWPLLLPAPSLALGVSGGLLLTIFLFFVKAGSFVFGSGLAIVPFLYEGVVRQHGWLNEQQFRDAVAVAMITPGPVVITVAFIGYLVAGFGGAVAAAVGIFLPVYLLTIIPAPWVRRHRDQPQLKAFAQGATAAATGAIAGAVIVLGGRAIVDVPTALIALGSLGVLWRYKVPEPVLVAVAGALGLALWVATHGAA